jgi:DNA invertase Pin-like site-specific DNA recombinase
MRQVIGYVRVSTDTQAEQGVSLEAQTEKIKAMATVQGAELAEVITDGGESAKTLSRPGMARLLSLVDQGKVDTVIVTKLDRLTRSVKDLADLLECFERNSVSLVSVAESLDTKTAAGRLVLNIMMSVSQWEREAVGERTTDAMQHLKRSKAVYSPIPFGYLRINDRLVERPEEMRVVMRIRELRSQGMSFARIADTLNEARIPTKNNGKWHAASVRYIAMNDLYQAV